MDYNTLSIQQEQGILFVRIERERHLNALNKEVISSLSHCLKNAFSNTSIKGIIITGAGEKAFVAGADIKEFIGLDEKGAKELAKIGHQVFDLIEHSPKPIIAALNGYALGGGFELALACHLRIASENARFGFPELGLGIIPGYGGTQRLSQIVGKGKSLELILTTEMMDSEEALKLGLVNAVVPSSVLLGKAEEMMRKIVSKSPEAIQSAIAAVNAYYTNENGYDIEIEEFSKCFNTDNFKEGISAFLEKRKPKFQ